MDNIFQLFEAFQEDMDRGFEIITERVHSADERIEEANDKLIYMSKIKKKGKALLAKAAMAGNNPNTDVKNELIIEK